MSLQVEDANRPPLPRRTSTAVDIFNANSRSRSNTLRLPKQTSRPALQAGATTALSLADIPAQVYGERSNEAYTQSTRSTSSQRSLRAPSPGSHLQSHRGSDTEDTASVYSSTPRYGARADAESILGDVLIADPGSPMLGDGGTERDRKELMDMAPFDMSEPTAEFNREFDPLEDMAADGSNEGIYL